MTHTENSIVNAKNNDKKSFIETSKKDFDEIQKVCKKLKDTHSKSCRIKNLVCINDSLGIYRMELKI